MNRWDIRSITYRARRYFGMVTYKVRAIERHTHKNKGYTLTTMSV